jgi:predicted aldo/keto reductase-like oxidoreductase
VGLVPINFTMASNAPLLEAIDQAARSGMGLVAMKTQAGGMLRPDRKLPKVLPPHSQTALLKWALQNQSFATAIPGVTAYDQLEQNFTVASSLEYTPAEREFLADKAVAAQAQFCQQCGQCRGDCPHGVDIPTLMRSHMYAVQYGNRDLALATLASIDTGRELTACGSCGVCMATCRNHVDIGSKIAQLGAARLHVTV